MKLTITFVAMTALAGCLLAQDRDVRGAIESRPSSDQIRSQVKNLDNDSFELRTKAMEGLRAAGEEARPELESALKSDSLEVRTRAETLIRELDSKKAGGTRKATTLKPVSPEGEAPEAKPRRGTAPRFDDFDDPNAYFEAMNKWMEEQLGRDARFPRFVLPDARDLLKDFDKDMVIIEPGDLRGGVGSMSVTHKNGETRTFKNGPDGVRLDVKRTNAAGEVEVETWEAKDLDEFKAKHPEVWEKYRPGEGIQTFTARPRDWKGWNSTDVPMPPPAPLAPMLPGVVAGPRLGVITSAVPPVLDKQLRLKGEGLVINSVSPGSLAERLGLLEHDVLVTLNGEVVRDREDILRQMTRKDAPATVTARVVREGSPVELSAPRDAGK
jgi:hypothetical protein